MDEIRWVTRWEALSLKDVENISDMRSDKFMAYKKELTKEILKHEYLFSGERHYYDRGVPLFYERGRPMYT